MARPKKVKSASEVKAERKGLQSAIKEIATSLKPHQDAAKDAEKVLNAAKKEADKQVAVAAKAAAAAAAKLAKAEAAAEKGKAKIAAKLAELESEDALV